MLYKSHQSSLEDSMRTVREFSTLKELADILNCAPERLRITYYAYDHRIGWELFTVEQFERYHPGLWDNIGFCNGIPQGYPITSDSTWLSYQEAQQLQEYKQNHPINKL